MYGQNVFHYLLWINCTILQVPVNLNFKPNELSNFTIMIDLYKIMKVMQKAGFGHSEAQISMRS